MCFVIMFFTLEWQASEELKLDSVKLPMGALKDLQIRQSMTQYVSAMVPYLPSCVSVPALTFESVRCSEFDIQEACDRNVGVCLFLEVN